MRRLSIKKYVKDVTRALPLEERDAHQRALRRELNLLADAYLERGKSSAEAERAAVAHYDPTYTVVTRARAWQEVSLVLVMAAALSILGLVLPQTLRLLSQPRAAQVAPSDAISAVGAVRDAALAGLGTFQTTELALPAETASYALFLMQGDTLISATSGTLLPAQENGRLGIVFGPTYATNYRCGSEARSLYTAVAHGDARPDVSFSCYKAPSVPTSTPAEAAHYLTLYESILREQPRRLIGKDTPDPTFNVWMPLMAYFERPYGWRDKTPESFYFERVPLERWYVLYLVLRRDMADVTTLELPALQDTLAAEDNLLSFWSELEQSVKTAPQPR